MPDAQLAIEYVLERWFPTFTRPSTLSSVLKQNDLELYCAFPMLRGLGGKNSVRRFGLLAHCAALEGFHEEAREYLALAELALERRSDNVNERCREWIRVVNALVEIARSYKRVNPLFR